MGRNQKERSDDGGACAARGGDAGDDHAILHDEETAEVGYICKTLSGIGRIGRLYSWTSGIKNGPCGRFFVYRLYGRIHSPVEQLWKMTKKPSLSVKAEEGTKVQISAISSGGASLFSAGRA